MVYLFKEGDMLGLDVDSDEFFDMSWDSQKLLVELEAQKLSPGEYPTEAPFTIYFWNCDMPIMSSMTVTEGFWPNINGLL